MRRPIRPFTIEKKQGGRAAEKAPSAPVAQQVFADFVEPARKSSHRDPNLAAAEALFSRPAERKADADASVGDPRRILPSLEDQPPSPLEQMLSEAPKRRGRKPGSKNKPKEIVAEAVAAPEPKKRGRKPGSKNKPRAQLGFSDTVGDTTDNVQPQLRQLAPLTSLRRIGRMDRSELPRGERWKARLPRFAR